MSDKQNESKLDTKPVHSEIVKTSTKKFKLKFTDFNILNKFSDDEKWLMISESRPSTMRWIICEPINFK